MYIMKPFSKSTATQTSHQDSDHRGTVSGIPVFESCLGTLAKKMQQLEVGVGEFSSALKVHNFQLVK